MSEIMDLKKVILFLIVIFYGFQSYRDERMHVGHQEGNLWIAAGAGGQGTGEGGVGVPRLPQLWLSGTFTYHP